MSIVHSCPVCNSQRTQEFLRHNGVPVHQNLVFATRQDALQTVRGDLAMTACYDCGFVFNNAFDWGKLAHGANYDNSQTHSPYFTAYMSDLVDRLIHKEGVKNSNIIEVGCGKGMFLKMLVEDPSAGNVGIGFDPSYVGPDTDENGRLRFERRYFDESCAGTPADVVICRHVIEHVAEPLKLLGSMRQALNGKGSPRIYLETPCVEWILRNQVIWDFCYEHCSLFTKASLKFAMERSGFKVHHIQHQFGGQYLWAEASLADNLDPHGEDTGNISSLAEKFSVAEKKLQTEWRSRILKLTDHGKVAVWGAGAKGTTFVNIVDPENKLFDCLVDLNPNKQNKFVSGTGHAIVDVQAIKSREVHSAILMNPNYRKEIETILSTEGIALALVE